MVGPVQREPRSVWWADRLANRDRDAHADRLAYRDRDAHADRLAYRDRDAHADRLAYRDRDAHADRLANRDRDFGARAHGGACRYGYQRWGVFGLAPPACRNACYQWGGGWDRGNCAAPLPT